MLKVFAALLHSLLSPGSTMHPEAPPLSATTEAEIVKERTLERTIGLSSAVLFIVGTTIGSGIFASPGIVLLHAKSTGMSLVLWVR